MQLSKREGCPRMLGSPQPLANRPVRSERRPPYMAAATSSSVPEPVRFQRQANVLVVTIDNPPVNALGVDVRRGLVAAIDAAEADAELAAVLLVGAGRNFIAGADIR